jgi:hypothetical protein
MGGGQAPSSAAPNRTHRPGWESIGTDIAQDLAVQRGVGLEPPIDVVAEPVVPGQFVEHLEEDTRTKPVHTFGQALPPELLPQCMEVVYFSPRLRRQAVIEARPVSRKLPGVLFLRHGSCRFLREFRQTLDVSLDGRCRYYCLGPNLPRVEEPSIHKTIALGVADRQQFFCLPH